MVQRQSSKGRITQRDNLTTIIQSRKCMSHFERIISVVRGDAQWSSLRDLGVSRDSANAWHMPAPICDIVAPSASHIAGGILKLQSSPNDLSEWASFLLAASPLLTFDDLTKSKEGEALLDGLWDLAFGNAPSPELLRIARADARPVQK